MQADERRAGPDADASALLARIRLVVSFFMLGLFLSGVTAFPLRTGLNLSAQFFHADALTATGSSFAALGGWIVRVRDGLGNPYAADPFIAYGTDWLAFPMLCYCMQLTQRLEALAFTGRSGGQ